MILDIIEIRMPSLVFILAAKHLRNAMQMAKIFRFICARVIHIASTKTKHQKKWTERLYISKYLSFHDVSQFKVRLVLQIVNTFRYTNFLLTWHVLATVHWFFATNARSHVYPIWRRYGWVDHVVVVRRKMNGTFWLFVRLMEYI